jgi:DNA-binding CsgD family transcriptional regulator
MNIPATEKEIIEKLEKKYGYTLNKIVTETKISLRTLSRALAGQQIAPKTKTTLIMLYIYIEQTFNQQALSQTLTEREKNCLYWSALGKTSRETAKLLQIQTGTVEQHRKKIKRKLQCKSMAEAVFKGMQMGYVPTSECASCCGIISNDMTNRTPEFLADLVA